MKCMIKRYWGNRNVYDILSLELETLDERVKATVDGIIRVVSINSDNVILFLKLGKEVLKVGTLDKNNTRITMRIFLQDRDKGSF